MVHNKDRTCFLGRACTQRLFNQSTTASYEVLKAILLKYSSTSKFEAKRTVGFHILEICQIGHFFHWSTEKLVDLMGKSCTLFLLIPLFMSVSYFSMHMFMLTPTLTHFCSWNSNRTHTYHYISNRTRTYHYISNRAYTYRQK